MADPIVTLPPYEVVEPYLALAPPRLWHLPDEPWKRIWAGLDASHIKIAILDTGYTKHEAGPRPIVERSYTGEPVADGNGHGTHVAGTALGSDVGVCRGAQLMVYKVLSNRGSGSSSGIAAAIRQAVDDGANVVNMSLGGGSPYTPTNEAIDYAWSKGCWVNAAAGNSGFNGGNTIGWPAKHPSCLCNASYAEGGNISSFSSGGRQIDWAAPGSQIVSWRSGGGYAIMSGTSMATPYGSGVLGIIYNYMLREGVRIYTVTDDMRQFFKENMQDGGAPGFDERFGFGIPMIDDILQTLVDKDFQWN